MYTPEPMSIPQPNISTTPLIGVLQVLLFVFLFNAPPHDQAQAFNLSIGGDCLGNLPAARVRTVEIKANAQGTVDLSLEGDPVDVLTLLARLRHARGDDRLALNVDTGMDVPYGEACRLHGHPFRRTPAAPTTRH